MPDLRHLCVHISIPIVGLRPSLQLSRDSLTTPTRWDRPEGDGWGGKAGKAGSRAWIDPDLQTPASPTSPSSLTSNLFNFQLTTSRYGGGDLQWMTAGAGVVHGEMFPLVSDKAANTCRFFQIWLNLPARSKMAPPTYRMVSTGGTYMSGLGRASERSQGGHGIGEVGMGATVEGPEFSPVLSEGEGSSEGDR